MDEKYAQSTQGITYIKTKRCGIYKQCVLYKTYITKLDFITRILETNLDTTKTQYYENSER